MIKAYPDYKFEMSPNCPLCDGKGKFEIAARSNDNGKEFIIQLFSCTQCGTAYHNPRMSREAIHQYYSSGQYRSEKIGKDRVDEKIITAKMRTKYMSELFGATPRRFLDVGCGRGLIVKEFSEMEGCEAVGYDIYQHPEASIPIVTDRDKLEGKFDLIFCLHLLEHLYDPLEMLKWIESKLSDDGLAYIELPLRRQLIVPHPFLFSFKAVGMMIGYMGLAGVALDFKKDVAVIFAHRGTRWSQEELYGFITTKTGQLELTVEKG